MIQTKPKSKRGRKSKPDWQRLRNEVKLHLDDGNYAVVKDMAHEAGLSLNKFITRAVMGATIRKALTDDEYSMVRSLQGIANNLNQLTRCANGMGFDTVASKVDSMLTITLDLLSKSADPQIPNVMIAKFKNRIDFAGLVSYANDIKCDEKRGRLLSYKGVCVVSNETIADSFNTQLRRPDSKGKIHHIGKPVKHVSISFSPDDAHMFPDNEEGDRFMAHLVNEWLRGMGIINAQYIVARHFDKAHPHCHLVYSRIALDGSVISAYNEQLRSADVCKKIKLRHGLTFGNMTGEKVNHDRLRPIQQLRFDIKSAGIAAANRSTSWAEFQHALESHGIEACFSINHSTGEIRGISFAKDSYRFAGSKLSKQKLAYGKLVAKFGALPVEGVDILSTPNKGFYEGRFGETPNVGENVLFAPSRDHRFNSEEGTGELTAPYQDSGKRFSKTESPFEGVLPNSIPTEPLEVSLIPLSLIIDLLTGPAVIQSSCGGGTTNGLDWNDERRRRQEAQENQYIHKTFKRRR